MPFDMPLWNRMVVYSEQKSDHACERGAANEQCKNLPYPPLIDILVKPFWLIDRFIVPRYFLERDGYSADDNLFGSVGRFDTLET